MSPRPHYPQAQIWSFATGRRGVNRVRVFERPGVRIRMVVAGASVNLGHRDRARAVQQARAKAAEIHRPRHERKRAEILAVRSDLLRVARACGLPEGVAPSMGEYRKRGRFSDAYVQGLHLGWWTGERGLREHWCDSIPRYGLKPYRDAIVSPRGSAAIVADIRRVALKVGSPLRMPTHAEYDQHGRWTRSTAQKWLGMKWSDMASVLGLSMEGRRGNQHTTRLTKANTQSLEKRKRPEKTADARRSAA